MLRKQGGDLSQNANSNNDHSGIHGFTAPFDESGSDIIDGSEELSM